LPEERRQQIIDGAVSFFSEVGFDGGTRLLAKRLGITQSLIFYFFPKKSDLLQEVYKSVFLDHWRAEWEDQICDRDRPLRQRLVDFYMHYSETLFTPKWIRICLFAALRGCEIDRWWMNFFEEKLVRKICIEIRHEAGLPRSDEIPITAAETETYWNFHGGIFNYGVRREVHQIQPQIDLPTFIELSVDSLLNGFPTTVKSMLFVRNGNT
jgi:AcrR family transcriptional regulator